MSGAVPPPAVRPLGRVAGVPRPVCRWFGRCGRGDPAPAPQRAPLRACVARCRSGGRASSQGGAFHHHEGRLRSGAPPPPTACPLGGLLGSITRVLQVRACGCGGPSLSPWPACPVGAACHGGGGGPSPGKLARHRCEGRLVSGAVPPPAARPLGRAAGVPRPLCPGCGQCGRGPSTGPTACALAGRRCSLWGWRKGNPGGSLSTVVRGVCGQAPPPPPNLPPTGRAVGVSHPHAVGAGVWLWRPITVPLACMPCGGCVPRGWWGAVTGEAGPPPL